MQNNKYAAAVATVRAKEKRAVAKAFLSSLSPCRLMKVLLNFFLDAGISNADKGKILPMSVCKAFGRI